MTDGDIFSEKQFNCRVSSVLGKNVTLFGKKFLFDNDDSTCWNSDQGSPQWIKVEFDQPVTFSKFQIQFQGGFIGTNCTIETWSATDPEIVDSEQFYPENNNLIQTFQLKQSKMATNLKLTFLESDDTYGRIVIYKFSLFR